MTTVTEYEKAATDLLKQIDEQVKMRFDERDTDLADRLTNQLKALLPDALKAWKKENPDFHLPGTEDTKEEYSIARFALSIAQKDPKIAPYEHECAREMNRLYGEQVRDAATSMDTSFTSGGDTTRGEALVPEAHLNEFIDLLRSESVVFQSGARAMPNQFGTITIPVLATGSAATWSYESEEISQQDPTIREHTMRPRRLAGAVRLSNMLITNSRPTAESIVRHDLMEQFRVALDTAVLEGDGANQNPTGIINAIANFTGESVAGAVDLTSGWSFVLAMEFLTDLANADALSGSLGWVMNPTDWSRAIQMPSGTTGVDVNRIVTQDGAMTRLLGYPIRTTTILANGGATAGEETVIFGDFSQVRVPFWKTLEVRATDVGAGTFIRDQTLIRGILYADISIDHQQSFSIGTTAQ